MTGPTDVLSFPHVQLPSPASPPADGADADPATGLTPLGDMVISLERARAQAEEYGHPLERELCYLAVHSVLHLLGLTIWTREKRRPKCGQERRLFWANWV